MSEKSYMQRWTRKEVEAAIAEVLKNEPEGANREYWTSELSASESVGPQN